MEIKEDLPKFSKQAFDLNTWKLCSSGFVREPKDLGYNDLLALLKVSLTDDFTCLEGWQVKGVVWEGVKLSNVLVLLGLKPETRFIRLASGDFSVVLTLERAMEATTILALRKGGVPLDEYHGGPVRLVLHVQECYESVKGLNKIDALESAEEGTAARIALGRIPNR
jgi:DMSO/TMAO reductase YedYZ molybdopterin-dependent catalytic subunit